MPNTQFVIPVYQRDYVWSDKKEVKKYLEDFKDVIDATNGRHFIGIVMYLKLERRINFYEVSIVDGQQRLVTTFLILYALKKIAIESGETQKAEQITNQYLINPYAESEDKLKLKPLVSDDDVFKKIVSDSFDMISNDDRKSKVYINYNYIKKFLKSLYGRHSIDEMLSALNKFYLVAIPLDSESDDAQKIFETINSAGKDLSKSDLIRNYILMNVDNENQDRYYRNYWYKLEKLFNNKDKLENFFRLFLANRTYSLCNLEEVYDVFQSWYKDYRSKPENTIESALKLIYNYAIYYTDLFIKKESDLDVEESIKKALIEFKKNTIEPTAPLLMEVYSLYRASDNSHEHLVSADSFVKIINLFNTYTIRRNICNQRTGILTRIIPLMLKSVLDSCSGDYSNIYEYCVSYLVDNGKDKQSFMPDDEYVRNYLISGNAYAMKRYLKTIFEKIESYNNPAVVDFSGLSIEHLMPQTPTEQWLRELNVSKEVYENYLHRLGNLTLATSHDNSAMQNRPFDFKKEILQSTSHIKMNQEILALPKWDIEEIEKRTDKLITQICELYPYVSVGNNNSRSYDIYLGDDETYVKAKIFNDYTVEIQEESHFNGIFSTEIQKLIDEDVLQESNGQYIFKKAYPFENLEKTTKFLMPENTLSEWELWKDYNGNSLSFDIRVKLANNRQ